jgi:hypothetical protein
MRGYIRDKIEHYTAELMQALDSNDYLSAIKLRAVQKELQELLSMLDDQENALPTAENDLQNFYTTSEAAKILGVHPSSVTRRAASLNGQRISGRWYYPKKTIDEEKIRSQGRKKPGRKRK